MRTAKRERDLAWMERSLAAAIRAARCLEWNDFAAAIEPMLDEADRRAQRETEELAIELGMQTHNR